MGEHAPLRVLQVLNHMDFGGIESVVMNYYRFIDRRKVQFDFAVSKDSRLPQSDEIKRLGGSIYQLPQVLHPGKYIAALMDILRERSYQVVHCHMNTLSVLPLLAAYLAGTRVRICHNHTTAHFKEGLRTVVKYGLRPLCKWFATDYFACGEYAGRWMYGNRCFDAGNVYVMRNAIDTQRFQFEPAKRERVRNELGIADKFVIGHIGRFMYQKNHAFLVDVFYEVYQRRKDAVLLLVGEGELLGRIRDKVQRMGIADAVIFYGSSRDTGELYPAMDLFCLPSFYEGVPVVAIEAQGNGLPVLVSDKVSQEAKLQNDYMIVPLSLPAGVWAVKALSDRECGRMRERGFSEVREAGFSIQSEAVNLQTYYVTKNL